MNILRNRSSITKSGAYTARLILFIYGLGAGWREVPITLRALLAAATWWVPRGRNTRVRLIRRGLVGDLGSEFPSRGAPSGSWA